MDVAFLGIVHRLLCDAGDVLGGRSKSLGLLAVVDGRVWRLGHRLLDNASPNGSRHICGAADRPPLAGEYYLHRMRVSV